VEGKKIMTLHDTFFCTTTCVVLKNVWCIWHDLHYPAQYHSDSGSVTFDLQFVQWWLE